MVTSYLGDLRDAHEHLRAARRYFRSARLIPAVLPPEGSLDADGVVDSPYSSASILVVGSYSSYQVAVRAAKVFSDASGLPYSTQGMVFDQSRGLIIPDNDPDEAWRGRYLPRRYDGCGSGFDHHRCVTVERSEGYDGFHSGLYIVVAGILGRDAEARRRLEEARRIVSTAYVRQTVLYMGCLH